MTFSRSLLFVLAITAFVLGCKKEYSTEGGELPGIIDEAWEFTAADVLHSGPMDSGTVQSIGTVSTLSMVGSTSADEEGEIFLQIVGETITTGTYTNPLVFFQYSEGGNVIYQSSPVQTGGFSIVITEMDSTYVAGTFSGTVLDAQGAELTLTNGKFKTVITSWEDDDTPEPVQTGQLTVWSREICNDGTGIEIRIDGQTAVIEDGLTAEPDCGASTAPVFTLQAGNYTLEAICGSDTTRYEVAISDRCTILEIDLESPPEVDDYLPLIHGSFWEYADLDDPGTTQTIMSDATEPIENRMFTRFVSTLGDSYYYRKDQGVYYEYRTLNFQGYVDNPPSIEMVILYDYLDVGQSWETAGEDIVYSGIPVKVKLVSTINRRDFQQNFNGTMYTDLIEVNTEIFFSSDGGNSYQSSGSAYNTIFAKGKGIIYYYDIDRDIEWGIKNVTINP